MCQVQGEGAYNWGEPGNRSHNTVQVYESRTHTGDRSRVAAGVNRVEYRHKWYPPYKYNRYRSDLSSNAIIFLKKEIMPTKVFVSLFVTYKMLETVVKIDLVHS
jgi:hypothetical protein